MFIYCCQRGSFIRQAAWLPKWEGQILQIWQIKLLELIKVEKQTDLRPQDNGSTRVCIQLILLRIAELLHFGSIASAQCNIPLLQA